MAAGTRWIWGGVGSRQCEVSEKETVAIMCSFQSDVVPPYPSHPLSSGKGPENITYYGTSSVDASYGRITVLLSIS